MTFCQPYGRNWGFLWNVPIPKYQILLLIITFFIGVWAAMLIVLTHFSKTHTWLLPVFAVGLGAPRWCQVRRQAAVIVVTTDPDSVRCYGVLHLLPFIFLGQDPADRISACLCGYGSVFSMPCRVLASE